MIPFGRRWQRSITYSELNLLFPVATFDRIYDARTNDVVIISAEDVVQQLLKLPLIRVFLTYGAMILFGAAHVKMALIFLGVAALFFLIEVTVTDALIISNNTTAEATLGLVCSFLPLNYILNVSADRGSGVASFLASVQTIIIVTLITILVFAVITRVPYANAWSCYGAKPVEEWNQGPCPLYTKDYLHSYACRDNTNAECLGNPTSKAWRNPRQFEMHCITVLASLYGLHVANTLLLLGNDLAPYLAHEIKRARPVNQ